MPNRRRSCFVTSACTQFLALMQIEEAYHAIRAHVGKVSQSQLTRTDPLNSQRFGMAVGEARDADGSGSIASQSAGIAIAEVSPLYLTSVMGWESGPPESKLRGDGAAMEQFAGLPVEGLRLMGAGQEVEFLAAITEGMEWVRDTLVEDVQFKQGKSGGLIIMKLRHVFRQDGKDVLSCVETFIGR